MDDQCQQQDLRRSRPEPTNHRQWKRLHSRRRRAPNSDLQPHIRRNRPGGSYHITANLVPADVVANYNITNTGANFTIDPATLDITANNQSKNYGDTFSFTGQSLAPERVS